MVKSSTDKASDELSELDDKLREILEAVDPHDMNNGMYGSISTEEAIEEIRSIIQRHTDKAVQQFAQNIQRKVKLEFEAGGRYPGHLIDPWTDVARPIIYKAALTNQREESK